MEIEIGKYRKVEEGYVFEYWVNEVFKTTAHVDTVSYPQGSDNKYHTFDRRYPLWLIEQQIIGCEKFS